MRKKKYLRCLAMMTAFTLSMAMAGNLAVTASADTTPSSNQGGAPSGNGNTPGSGNTPDSGNAPGGGDTSGGSQPGDSSQSSSISYTAVKEYTEDATLSDAEISSTGTDENAILLSSGTLTLDNVTIDRTSSSSTGGDNSSFYGVGATILNKGGTAYVNNCKITSDAKGAAGVFSYSSGVSYVKDTSITTQQSCSGGIHVAGGGTLYAYDCNVNTSGGSAAAIRSDRGGGTMVVDGGTYTSSGSGSPAVYTTADITVNDAELTANGSEGVCIEGLNTLRLYGSTLTSNMPDDSQNDSTWSVILYQSMSGDSETGCSEFTMEGGKLISKNGGLFYTTNTESNFVLNDVDITASDDSEYFLMCTGNSNARGWGSTGSNGADCTFTGINQTMKGDIIWDSISQLDLYLTDGSALTGAVTDDESYAGSSTGSGYANMYISKDSTWTVTGDSTVSNLYNAGTIKDASGRTVTIKTSAATLVSGDSPYTITVTKTYSANADLTKAGTIDSYSSHKVDYPGSDSGETHVHSLVKVEATDATCTNSGNSEYWYCNDTDCGKYFSDAEGKTEIEKDSWIIPATGHSYTTTVTAKATASQKGNILYQCKSCGSKYNTTISAKKILSISASNKTVKFTKVKKSARTIQTIKGTSNIKTSVTYKVSSYGKKAKKYLKLNTKTGKITVKKGTPKGTYTLKIKVTAKGNTYYSDASAVKKVKVKVK